MPFSDKVYEAFYRQKKLAAKRGIDFLFDFADWVLWWEENLGSNWFQKRGRKGDQFCMARFNDSGPYVRGNVKCLTMEDNVKERKPSTNKNPKYRKGINHPSARLTEKEVVEIFYSEKSNERLALLFGVHRVQIRDIKNKKAWKHLTTSL